MNGIHDMGGMDGMGPIEPEKNADALHEPWEGRVFALGRATGRWARGRNWPGGRFLIESIPAADYLRMSYYELRLVRLVKRLVGSGLLTPEEIDSGKADPNRPRPELLPASSGRSRSFGRLDDVELAPRYGLEQRVRARNMHPRGHTRLPRYTRGKEGVVVRDHGVFDMQDTDEDGQRLGYRPQHVYTVRFTARELWGDRGSSRATIHVEMWEDYLEPV